MSITVKNFGEHKRVTSCAAMFVDNNSILDTYNKVYKTLDTTIFGEKYNLIINSSLYNLPSVKNSLPTCFAIDFMGTKLIITAKHAINYCLVQTMTSSLDELFKSISVVFGYDDNSNNHSIKSDEIFKIKGVYKDSYNNEINPYDFVILELKEPKSLDKKLLGKLSESEIELNSKIYAVGHPYGMPLYTSYGKVYGEAKTKNKEGYYITDLSAFNGHSGAPVFDKNSKEIIGLIFGGATDFKIVKKKIKDKDDKEVVRLFKELRYRKFHIEKENGIFILSIHKIIEFLNK